MYAVCNTLSKDAFSKLKWNAGIVLIFFFYAILLHFIIIFFLFFFSFFFHCLMKSRRTQHTNTQTLHLIPIFPIRISLIFICICPFPCRHVNLFMVPSYYLPHTKANERRIKMRKNVDIFKGISAADTIANTIEDE